MNATIQLANSKTLKKNHQTINIRIKCNNNILNKEKNFWMQVLRLKPLISCIGHRGVSGSKAIKSSWKYRSSLKSQRKFSRRLLKDGVDVPNHRSNNIKRLK